MKPLMSTSQSSQSLNSSKHNLNKASTNSSSGGGDQSLNSTIISYTSLGSPSSAASNQQLESTSAADGGEVETAGSDSAEEPNSSSIAIKHTSPAPAAPPQPAPAPKSINLKSKSLNYKTNRNRLQSKNKKKFNSIDLINELSGSSCQNTSHIVPLPCITQTIKLATPLMATDETSRGVVTSSSSSSSSSSSEDEQESEEKNEDEGEAYADDDDDNNRKSKNTAVSGGKKWPKFIEKLNDDYDNELEKIGDRATEIISNGSFFNYGLYQFLSFLFISIAWTIGNGWYAYVSVFTGYTSEHECDVKSMGDNYTVDTVDTKCSAFDLTLNKSVKCTKWTYDITQMKTTIISEFDLVCDFNYAFELAYSLEQIGYIVGTLIFSFVADVIGRKPVLVGVLYSMCFFGFVQCFCTNFIAYFVLGFLINSLACGLEAVCVTLVLEMFSTSKRTLFGIGIEVVWVIVLASMSPLAYLIKTWREIRLVIFVVLAVLSLMSTFLVQESIRWLISLSKIKKCNVIIDRIAKFNSLSSGGSTCSSKSNASRHSSNARARYEIKRQKLKQMLAELEIFNKLQQDQEKETLNKRQQHPLDGDSSLADSSTSMPSLNKKVSSSVRDVFSNAKFRIYVLIMALNWFATALVYDGLTYMNNYIGANIFVNWIAMNIIELPAQFVCYYVISRYGRRMTVSLTLILAGVTLLTTLCTELIPQLNDVEWLKLTVFVLAKFIVTQSYSAVILHAPELFPTNLRSFGYGICLFSGKVTSVLSPIISIYISKILPFLPPIIYGSLSIICGIVSLYVPETLNRPLPNSIYDVIKWPRSLSPDEWKEVKRLNDHEMKRLLKCFNSRTATNNSHKELTINTNSPLSTSTSNLTTGNKPGDFTQLETIVVSDKSSSSASSSSSSSNLNQTQSKSFSNETNKNSESSSVQLTANVYI